MNSSELPPAPPVLRRDPDNILTPEALRHLQPHPGGSWSCSSTHPDGFIVAYTTPGHPHDSRFYVMHTCPDDDAVRKFCGNHIYHPSARPIVVTQPGLATPTFSLPLRPQPAIIGPEDHDNDALASYQFVPVPGIHLDGIEPQIGVTTDLNSPIEHEAPAPNMVAFQETNLSTPVDDQHFLLAGQDGGDIDWSIPNPFIHEDATTLNPEQTSLGGSGQLLQPENSLSPASWDQNWNDLTGMGENVDQQAWDSVFPDS